MGKVLGIGNALVDIMTKLESDELLMDFSLPKGSMQLVDNESVKKVMNGTEHLEKKISSGGSAANTIHGLARLNVETGFMGKVGNDEFGVFFENDLKESGISPKLYKSKTNSGHAVALISPDSERTFATFLGAAVELSADDLSSAHFKDFDYFHIEGYLVQNHDLIEQALKLAKKNNLKISLDLASYNVVEENLEFLISIVEKYVDIIFANEEEAKAFTGKDPLEALDIMSEKCEIAIVKIGSKGSLIKNGDDIFEIGTIDVNPKDTTGAGDLYASGFLYGLVKGFSLLRCGEIASILSGKVIEVIGAKMENDRWEDVRKLIKNTEIRK
ncbi:MAG: adenosine kinase [Bacteroidales bacterium]|nr:adenosine kinase [Bacteroidales bacterium]